MSKWYLKDNRIAKFTRFLSRKFGFKLKGYGWGYSGFTTECTTSKNLQFKNSELELEMFNLKINQQIQDFIKEHPEPVFKITHGNEYCMKIVVDAKKFRETYYCTWDGNEITYTPSL